ncbi:MAG TPA: 50S ribosomal protein L9 [Opitutales bacterium]|nr:50S ribosomal protein L9 [Opitutales bacterium]
MANNQVLLLKPIHGLGAEGDTVTVRAGYARNFLLPRKLALPITQANKKQIESLLKAREVREQKELDDARSLAEQIEAKNIAIAVKTGEGGKMFGAVTANDLIERLKEEGIELAKKQLSLPAPIKELGSHAVTVKLAGEVSAELKFEVVSENPIEEAAEAEAEAAVAEEKE